MGRCIGHHRLGAILHAEQSTMGMSKLTACPNSLQEPSSCILFHLELTSPCKTSLLYSLTGFSWILRKRYLAAMRSNVVRPGSSQSQGWSNLEQGTWVQRTGRTAYPESLQQKDKDTQGPPHTVPLNLTGNQTCSGTQRHGMKVQLPAAAGSWSKSTDSLLYLVKKLKAREVRVFHARLSLSEDESKEGIFLFKYLLRSSVKKSPLSFPSVFRQRLFLHFQCCEIEYRRKQIYFAYTVGKKRSHKSSYKYMHVPKNRCTYQSIIARFFKLRA